MAAGVFFWYVSDYYHATSEAMASITSTNDGSADNVEVRKLSGGELAFVPQRPSAGFIFYPGAKVQPEAYAPLMEQCARRGVLCVVVMPPFNLAILSPNAADGIREQFPEVARWAIGGHSLGGVVASDYLSSHEDSFDALLLLAAYPSKDLSAFKGNVLQVVGDNDKVVNRQRYEEARKLLPNSSAEVVIAGGNHAQFGNYGAQAGDGEATISADAQQEQTALAICEVLTPR